VEARDTLVLARIDGENGSADVIAGVRQVVMSYIGQIEFPSRQSVGRPWLRLIDSHPALGHPPPVMGFNPATRQPIEIKVPGSTAQIVKDGMRVGGIEWAMDDSPWLLVDADDAWVDYVVIIAEDVASRLGGRFVRD
jgi:hypothetical protein